MYTEEQGLMRRNTVINYLMLVDLVDEIQMETEKLKRLPDNFNVRWKLHHMKKDFEDLIDYSYKGYAQEEWFQKD